MTTLVAFFFVIGLIVFVHELGHFVMARRCGVRVEVFSLGFGPKLMTFRRNGTEYCISAIPLGGYVKMAGERAGAAITTDGFLSKTKWQRGQILAAGPAMNLVFAAVIIAGVALTGIDAALYESKPAIVGAVLPGSPAERAGILRGDQVLSVAGQSTKTWNSVEVAIGMRPQRSVLLDIRRKDQTIAVSVVPESDPASGVGAIGILGNTDSVTHSITQAEPGDDSSEHEPASVAANTAQPNSNVAVAPASVRRADVLTAARIGMMWTAQAAGLILQTLQGLISGDIPTSQLMGPIGIAQLSGEAANISLSALFCIMALLSVNVGVFNLLPIPVLDGGHIMMLAIEAVMGRDFTASARQMVARGGLAILLILMVIVFYNDLSRLAWAKQLIGA